MKPVWLAPQRNGPVHGFGGLQPANFHFRFHDSDVT